MSAASARPRLLPQPTPVTQPFWDGAKKRRLRIQRCSACREHVFYPRALCPHCGAAELEWVDASGRATIHSFTVARRPTGAGLECPYVIAIVELEEGPRMTANVVDCDPDALEIDDPVEAVFVDLSDDITLLRFRPAARVDS